MSAAAMTWSPQQEEIFTWFEKSTVPAAYDAVYDTHVAPSRVHAQHLIVRARAGTGKSTTIRKAVSLAPETDVLIAAFSKQIQLDMVSAFQKQNITFNGNVQTLHAVGYACIRRFRERIRVEFNSTRADNLARQVCGTTAPDAVVRLVSKLHTKGREIKPHATTFGDLSTIQVTFECEPDEQWAACISCGKARDAHDEVDWSRVCNEEDCQRFPNRCDHLLKIDHVYQGYDAQYVEEKALDAMQLASQLQSGETIDGSDMIFLPVRNGWLTRQFDLVVVDEAQDMTTAQLEIALGVLRKGGRIAIVGDDRQAIFKFRGADSESLDRLKRELGAAELGLTTTYRCGKAIVDVARTIVPDFEAGPDNPEGIVRTLGLDEYNQPTGETLVSAAGPGDFVLSRVNAPLVSIAMKLLRAGKRTRVAGRDIGRGLTTLIKKLNARSVPELLTKIESWKNREVARHEAQLKATKNGRKAAIEAKIEAVYDQADMLISLSDNARNVTEVQTRVESLFTDDGLGQDGVITCSSVHRAKGLEANRVFVLQDTLRNNNIEEENIAYVAVTRAKKELVWASSKAL